jgi:hypothetical protein
MKKEITTVTKHFKYTKEDRPDFVIHSFEPLTSTGDKFITELMKIHTKEEEGTPLSTADVDLLN